MTEVFLPFIGSAERAAASGDIATADRIRDSIYGSGILGAYFAAQIVDDAIIKARAARRPTVADLKRVAA